MPSRHRLERCSEALRPGERAQRSRARPDSVDTPIGESARRERSTDKPRKTVRKPPRRTFAPGFKTEAVPFGKAGDRGVRKVAAALDPSETALGGRVHRSHGRRRQGPDGRPRESPAFPGALRVLVERR
jgi:hypothetical protein